MTEPFVNLVEAIQHLDAGKSLYSECEKCCVMTQRTPSGALQVLISEREDKSKSPWRFGQMTETELITMMTQRSENWKFNLRNKPAFLGEEAW